MIQLYLTYIIISGAFLISFYRLYEFIFKKKSTCSCSRGCSLKADIVKNIKSKQKVKSYQF